MGDNAIEMYIEKHARMLLFFYLNYFHIHSLEHIKVKGTQAISTYQMGTSM